jgi:hypothetical protein
MCRNPTRLGVDAPNARKDLLVPRTFCAKTGRVHVSALTRAWTCLMLVFHLCSHACRPAVDGRCLGLLARMTYTSDVKL